MLDKTAGGGVDRTKRYPKCFSVCFFKKNVALKSRDFAIETFHRFIIHRHFYFLYEEKSNQAEFNLRKTIIVIIIVTYDFNQVEEKTGMARKLLRFF